MFIRRSPTWNKASRVSYFTFRLVRSECIGGKVRQVTLLNLGRHFPVAQDDWPLLCSRIKQLIGGQTSLLPVELAASAERLAQRYAAQLVARAVPQPSVHADVAEARGRVGLRAQIGTAQGRADDRQVNAWFTQFSQHLVFDVVEVNGLSGRLSGRAFPDGAQEAAHLLDALDRPVIDHRLDRKQLVGVDVERQALFAPCELRRREIGDLSVRARESGVRLDPGVIDGGQVAPREGTLNDVFTQDRA